MNKYKDGDSDDELDRKFNDQKFFAWEISSDNDEEIIIKNKLDNEKQEDEVETEELEERQNGKELIEFNGGVEEKSIKRINVGFDFKGDTNFDLKGVKLSKKEKKELKNGMPGCVSKIEPKKYKGKIDLDKKRILDSCDKEFNFHKLNFCNSYITCHGRPKVQSIKDFKNKLGINAILTLQHSGEKIHEIEKAALQNNMIWMNIKMCGANMSNFTNEEQKKQIVEGIIDVYSALKSRDLIMFIHCAAGLHRTGVVVYTLLRLNGESPENALNILEKIRYYTRHKVGQERLDYAEKILLPCILNR